MVAKVVIVVAAVVAVAPAVATVVWPAEDTAAEVVRSVELHGPILGFTQSRDRIQIRLLPAATEAERNARSHVKVSDADGDAITIPLKRGQTWANAELPQELASAPVLDITVE